MTHFAPFRISNLDKIVKKSEQTHGVPVTSVELHLAGEVRSAALVLVHEMETPGGSWVRRALDDAELVLVLFF